MDKVHKNFPYETEISDISNLIEEYINTNGKEVFDKVFKNDHWNLTDILKACDYRIGKRRLKLLKEKLKNKEAQKIINIRLEKLNASEKLEALDDLLKWYHQDIWEEHDKHEDIWNEFVRSDSKLCASVRIAFFAG